MMKPISFLFFSLTLIPLAISSSPSLANINNNTSLSLEIIHRYNLDPATLDTANSLDSFVYAVKVGIGTFDGSPSYKPYYLRLDTFRPMIWTQCEGCVQCFPQNEPVFPRNQSKSYNPIPWDDPRCPRGISNYTKNCAYNTILSIESNGELAEDTFTFENNNNVSLSFGCGLENQLNYTNNFDKPSTISGVLGLSNGTLSLINQLSNVYGLPRRFSYCLQPFNSTSTNNNTVPMQLKLGVNISTASESGLKGALLRTFSPEIGNLVIYLSSMSVNENKLNLPLLTFRNPMINPGTAITQLSEVAYVILKAELVKIFSSYKGIRQVPGVLGLDLCYEGALGEGEHLPNITFGTMARYGSMDGDFVVQPEGGFYRGKSGKSGQDMFCLAMVQSSNGYTRFGAYQQVNKLIIYDFEGSQLLYKDQDCSQFN